MPTKNFHHPKLLVGNAHNAYMAFGWQFCFYPLYMYFCIFPAWAMPEINAELEHIEAICHNVLPEFGINLPVLFGFCWQVKKYEYPHDAICIKTLKHYDYLHHTKTSFRQPFVLLPEIIGTSRVTRDLHFWI